MTCLICSSGTSLFRVSNLRPLLICESCRHITWAEIPTDDSLALHYKESYGISRDQVKIQETQSDYYKSHIDQLLSLVPHDRRPSLLDYGCAWPTLLKIAKQTNKFEILFGVDHDDGARHHGSTFGLTMLPPDRFDAAVPDGTVDIIRFSHVIEHSLDPISLLKKARKKLSPAGYVYITQPNFPPLNPRIAPPGLKDAVFPEHLHFFTAISLSHALYMADLEPTELFCFQKIDEQISEYGTSIDFNQNIIVGRSLSHLKSPVFDPRGSYPFFLGENVCCFAKPRS